LTRPRIRKGCAVTTANVKEKKKEWRLGGKKKRETIHQSRKKKKKKRPVQGKAREPEKKKTCVVASTNRTEHPSAKARMESYRERGRKVEPRTDAIKGEGEIVSFPFKPILSRREDKKKKKKRRGGFSTNEETANWEKPGFPGKTIGKKKTRHTTCELMEEGEKGKEKEKTFDSDLGEEREGEKISFLPRQRGAKGKAGSLDGYTQGKKRGGKRRNWEQFSREGDRNFCFHHNPRRGGRSIRHFQMTQGGRKEGDEKSNFRGPREKRVVYSAPLYREKRKGEGHD